MALGLSNDETGKQNVELKTLLQTVCPSLGLTRVELLRAYPPIAGSLAASEGQA